VCFAPATKHSPPPLLLDALKGTAAVLLAKFACSTSNPA
jgi:hypothetical protein